MAHQSTEPAPPFRFPFYYGWIILVVGSLGVLASIPGQTMGISVLTDHLIGALGISRVRLSTAYMIGTLASSLAIPFAGRFLDRRGVRVTTISAMLLLALFLSLLSVAPQVVTLIGSGGHTATFLLITLLFLGIRFFGQGVVTVAPRTMVSRWFGPRRAFAVGLMGIVTVFGFSWAPQPLQLSIERFGWQQTLRMQSLVLILLCIPIVAIFYRSDPESCGLGVEEGLPPPAKGALSLRIDTGPDKTVREARSEYRFRLMMAILGSWALFSTAYAFHVISINAEAGTGATAALRMFFPMSLISVAAQLIGSYLADRLSLKTLFIIFLVMLSGSGGALIILHTRAGHVLLMLCYGIASGLFNIISVITWPKLYGRRNLGEISALSTAVIVAGSAIGPWLFSYVQALSGSYRSMGGVTLVVSVILIMAMIPLRFGDDLRTAPTVAP